MTNHYPQTWELDTLFTGGSRSSDYMGFVQSLKSDIKTFTASLKEKSQQLPASIQAVQDIGMRLQQTQAFVNCLLAQNTTDVKANELQADLTEISANYQTAVLHFDHCLSNLDNDSFQSLLKDPMCIEIAFALEERRNFIKEKMPLPLESLANDLAVDGFHGWSQMYDVIVSRILIPYENKDEKKLISVGQAYNLLYSPERSLRKQIFGEWQSAWSENKELVAHTLNHIAGFRSGLYRHRNWQSVLKHPLDVNRMQKKSLDMMWTVINRYRDRFLAFFEMKSKHLGLERLSWYDISSSWKTSKQSIPYDDAVKIILERFNAFSPRMAAFAKKALTDRWVESEDRPKKRPGGFCTGVPLSKASRIFMTYSGTLENISTLAHELGHAYHNEAMQALPYFSQRYPLCLAETASTFAELLVSHASLDFSKDKEERKGILADRVQRSIIFFLNIQARYLFECRFYEERAKGFVSAEQLSRLMVDAQKDAFGHCLEEYDPTFWASKAHFFTTSTSFYNFPYTVGYLFSLGLYAHSMREPAHFAAQYDAFLEDTGRMTVEQLAKKHLGTDLSTPDFWESAMQVAMEDLRLLELEIG